MKITRSLNKIAIAAISLGVAASLGGCGSSSDSENNDSSEEQVVDIDGEEEDEPFIPPREIKDGEFTELTMEYKAPLPVSESAIFDPEFINTMTAASHKAEASCMDDRGFKIAETRYLMPTSMDAYNFENLRPFGVETQDDMKAYKERLDLEDVEGMSEDSRDVDNGDSDKEGYDDAYYGTEEKDGCIQEAEDVIFEDVDIDKYTEYSDKKMIDVYSAARVKMSSEEEYVELKEKVKECMVEKGYEDYEMGQRIEFDYDKAIASAEEEIECKANLREEIDAVYDKLSEFEKELAEEHNLEELNESIDEMEEQLVKNAERILED